MTRIKDLVGQQFGRLKVVAFHGLGENGRGASWLCQCSCGSDPKVVYRVDLINGRTKSCGCLSKEKSAERIRAIATTHGQRKTRLYQTWLNMKQRCSNPAYKQYADYGGRGITVCERWLGSFEAFSEDMGNPPSDKHTIERRETNGNYEPNNCYWATRNEQALNKRNNVNLTFNGRTQSMTEWARELNDHPTTFRSRLVRGWTVEQAMTGDR